MSLMRSYDIDLIQLIDAVAKRPALYDKTHAHYFHVKYKQKLWREASKEVFPHWDSMQPQRKMKRVREIQQRWKNLRTCFTRELAMQRKEQQDRNEGRMVKPRKIYGYFKKMSFLLGKEHTFQVSDNDEHSEVKDDPLDRNFKIEFIDDIESDEKIEDDEELEGDEFGDDETTKVVSEPELFQNQIVDMSRTENIVNARKRFNDYDEDKHFLLSLINTFRKFNDKQKIEAKIEILQTLKKIQFADE
ncbi:hypothetical protein MSG28_013456 [Choristoneura fumiferana]|uniref:Uncharacterized protein n=1 Tax=Choristoneura fumiferana TaxID=7141 RepID=A0ACC0KTT1_CHOFU|nr:hypothetical protein MSG28_013456 [Choristoneura fumiferana]